MVNKPKSKKSKQIKKTKSQKTPMKKTRKKIETTITKSKGRKTTQQKLRTLDEVYKEVIEIRQLMEKKNSHSPESLGKSLKRLEAAGRRLGSIITSGTRNLLSGIASDLNNAFAAILIREEERRAAIVSRYMEPFAEALINDTYPNAGNRPPVDKTFVFSHSYGSYIWSNVLHNLMNASRIPKGITLFSTWYSFQAAVPRDAFQPGKQFSGVGKYFAAAEDRRFHCYFSYSDIVLQTAYLWAKGAIALGAYGPTGTWRGRSPFPVDCTSSSGESHGETEFIPNSGGYFSRIDSILNFRNIVELEK